MTFSPTRYGTFSNTTATVPLLGKTPRKIQEQSDLAKSKDFRMWTDVISKNFFFELEKNPKVQFEQVYKDIVFMMNANGVKNLSKSNLDSLKQSASREVNRELAKMEADIVKSCVGNVEKWIASLMIKAKLQTERWRGDQTEILICLYHAGLMTEKNCRKLVFEIINELFIYSFDDEENIQGAFKVFKEKNTDKIEEYRKIVDKFLAKEKKYVHRERFFPHIKQDIFQELRSKSFAKYRIRLN